MYKKFPLTAIALACLLAGCGGEEESSGGGTSNTNTATTLSFDSKISADEPESGKTIKTVNVKFSSQAKEAGSYTFTVDSGTATDGVDFFVPNTTVNFNKGDSKSSFDIEINSDGIYEGNEDFLITLASADKAEINEFKNKVEVTLRDIDSEPVVEFSNLISSVSEGTLNYKLDVALSSLSEKEISIPYTISGIAIAGSDYTLLNNSNVVTFAPKENIAHITLNIVNDSIPEGGESLVFTLGQPSIGELGKQGVHTVQILGELGLNDSGSTTFYDGQSFTATSSNNEFPGQDAMFGDDSKGHPDFDGHASKSWTKIDNAGNAMSYANTDQACVRDERTGLVWEVKSTTQPLPNSGTIDDIKPIISSWANEGDEKSYAESFTHFKARNYRYYYYNKDKNVNNSQEGVGFSSTIGFNDKRYPISNLAAFPNVKMTGYSQSNRIANSETYINYFNEMSICGFNDWRLPTIKELRSIHDHSGLTDTDASGFFPNNADAVHMSDTQSANSTGVIWCLETNTGKAKHCLKNTPTQIRAVRGLKL